MAGRFRSLGVRPWEGGHNRAAHTRSVSHALIPLHRRFSDALVQALADEVGSALDRYGMRRDLRVTVTGGSARRYRIAGREALEAAGSLVARTYTDPEVMRIVEAAAGEPVFPVPYAPEQFLATRLERAGDVHGWHWDDYAYALVFVLRNPPAELGGTLEIVPDVAWVKEDPQVGELVASRARRRFHPRSGSAYLLRAHTNLHRVAPLRAAAQRDVLCFSYASRADLARTVTHETIDAIAGGAA
jgi:hypothetical protein